MMSDPGSSPTSADDSDATDLAAYGYAQELQRSMGGFSSFAIAFSLISIITGIFANFTFGFQQMGPSVIWSWCVVAVGQLLVAVVLADLSKRIPLSGYGYQWSSRLINPHFGYFVGWLLLMQFLTGFPGVCEAFAAALCSSLLEPDAAADWVPWVAIGVISITALVHLFGIRLVSLVNDAGVIAEFVAVLAVTAALWGLWLWSGTAELTYLFTRTNPVTEAQGGLSAFALSLLMGAWCLTGFEAAADLAEETHRPREVVPRVILTAEISSAVFGFLMLGGLILSTASLTSPAANGNLVTTVLLDRLGPAWMPLIMIGVLVSIFACGVASMAATSRLLYSLARDRMLPGSRFLSAVHPRWQVPAGSIVLVWAVSVLVIVVFRRLDIITSISAAAGYLGYAGIVLASFRAAGPHSDWRRTLVRVTALIWTLIVVAALTLPEGVSGPNQISWLPAKSTLGALAVGIAVYGLIIRSRIRRGVAGPPQPGSRVTDRPVS